MANNAGANGPRVGASTGRSRNTLVNNASKLAPGGYVPPVSPGTALGLGSQTGAAEYGYLTQLAALRASRAAVVGQFRQARAGIRAALPDAVAHAANVAADRGIANSSIDLSGRVGAHMDAASALAAARQDKTLGLLGVQQGKLAAGADYYMTLANIEAQRRAEQAALAVQAFQGDEYDAVQQHYAAIYRELLQRLQDQQTGRRPRMRYGLGPTYDPAGTPGRAL